MLVKDKLFPLLSVSLK